MIHIVDYGVGNVQAFVNMYKRLGIEATRAANAHDLLAAKKVILPGVGAFDHAMDLLNASGMREPLDQMVLQQGVPVLGICVGMQMLADGSDEGTATGLGWVKGRVRSFASNPASAALPMPHMGWNDVAPLAGSPGALLRGLENDARFYFLHSYYFEPAEAADTVAMTDYGLEFACVVQRDHVSGVQFHPEKSHHWGAALLKNFAEL
ncbi:imidazole glycerol phosphate synthase subunit HisH [Hydrogenophaga sp. IBVHS1]|uniref:imidazole glycerol phosphate synthase subunit HisH n=1 Tax=unclassified Hydrogenophaga TaxID=2610897 RepID=UPI000A2D3398|nr:imidazole glycerol phosphate synthase subunit HisH [Hydrogenophaga sp. IBVHS1]OSZ71673.1 imidazole glycerol phosphate synthase subunit HisH [Hydrogenophaga sp. IBVHS1]